MRIGIINYTVTHQTTSNLLMATAHLILYTWAGIFF